MSKETLAPLVVVALLITVAVANLLWAAGVPSAAIPARLSPNTDPFPILPASSALHVLPVPASTNESTRLTLLSIQGLVNRASAQLYLDFDNETGNASSMLSFLVAHYGVSYDVVTQDWVYAHYLPSVRGFAVVDPSRPESVNIGTMVASLQDAVLAAPDTAPFLEGRYRLPAVLDYAASNWTTADSTQVYDRALEELYPRLNPDLLAILPPDRLDLRDYLIATRTFVFYEPQGVLASPAELAATQRILAAVPHGVPILGWFDSPTLTEENGFVQLASQYGKPIFGSQAVPNLSVLTSMGRSEVRTQPPPPPTPRLENKTYVVVAVPDGDNLDFIANRMRQLWAEPERGTFPIAWSLSPLLADLAPPYLDYYYGSATSDDRFVLGPSGAGYLYPDYLGPGDLDPYLQSTARYANATGMDVAWLLNAFVASEIPYRSSTLSAYVDALRPAGLVLDYDDQAKTQDAWMQAGTSTAAPVIRSTQLWTTMGNFFAKVGAAMATWDAGPHFLWVTVYTFRFDLHDAATMIRGLTDRTGGNLAVVTPEQLFALMQEGFVARARAQLASMRSDPFAATFLAPQLGAAQGWLDATSGSRGASGAAYNATLASVDLREAGLYEAAFALGLVVVAAALVAFAGVRGAMGTGVRRSLLRGIPLIPVAVAFALFMFALRAGLAANFWSYQWILVGVALAGVGRPLRRYLDRSFPRVSLLATAGLDLVFVALSLGTNVAFALAAIGTVAVIDAVLARETVEPAGLLIAATAGTGVGFLAGVDFLGFGVLALALLVPLAVRLPRGPREKPVSAKASYVRGFVVALPMFALAVASNYSLGLRLGVQGSDLVSTATILLLLAPLAALLVVRPWRFARPEFVQAVAFAAAAVALFALGFAVGTVLTLLVLAAAVGALTVAAEATLRRFVAGGSDASAAMAGTVAWIPLLLLFFRMPPVIYSLAVARLPEPIEALLYAPEYLFAARATAVLLMLLTRKFRHPTKGASEP
ncbi:MAG TPA: hypothetical protein VEY12_09865 [Thermoplasmata archaeon]|nr:hypothetical protein [Thermoplasmata archaeon]